MTLTEINNQIIDLNNARNQVLGKLLDDNIITQEIYDKYTINYAFFIFKASLYEKWFQKHKLNSDGYKMKYLNID